jgi:hypothetical protein
MNDLGRLMRFRVERESDRQLLADDAGGTAIRLLGSQGSSTRGGIPARIVNFRGVATSVRCEDSKRRPWCSALYRPIGGALRCG